MEESSPEVSLGRSSQDASLEESEYNFENVKRGVININNYNSGSLINIRSFFIACHGDNLSEDSFTALLDSCDGLFKMFAFKCFDDKEAISRMSRNLHRLVKGYDSRKGTPIQLVFRMCKNVVIDMYRESERKSSLLYVGALNEDDTIKIFDDYSIERFDNLIDSEMPEDIAVRLRGIIEKSSLRKSQKECWDKGGCPNITSKLVLDRLKKEILKDKVVRDYIKRR